jgi:2-polyprenyl-3-methyl-5-hydroxy-6-metoxy-1,4-benzoquinol methylase
MDTWNNAQSWERDWWDSVKFNTLNEEQKQLVYAKYMGLKKLHSPYTEFYFDLNGVSVLDIGSGPVSLLLKCANYHDSAVLDPLLDKHPSWVRDRYRDAGLKLYCQPGEKKVNQNFDEVWLYNCLQHTQEPKKIISNSRRISKIIRVFEWVDTPSNVGHPQSLEEKYLNKWLGGEGKVVGISEGGCVGKAYYGIFQGDLFDEF